MPVDRRLALHEAGHAVVAYHLGLHIYEIVMNKSPAYVLYEPGAVEENLLFTMAGLRAELKDDPENIYYHDIDEKDHQDINEMLWDRDAHIYLLVQAHHYFATSIQRFIDVPEIWAQIESLAEVLLRVDRIDGEDVKRLLKAGKPGTDSGLPGNLR